MLQPTIICGHSLFGRDSIATNDIQRIDVRNYSLFGNRYWFQNLPGMVYSAPVVIMEFNPRVLSNYPVIFWRALTRRPFIFWGHGFSARTDSPRWIMHLRRILAQQASALIFYSEKGRQDFIKLGISPEKLFVAPNTVDLESIWCAKSQQPSVVRDQIVYIGRLVPAKKPDVLVEAYCQIHKQIPDIGLTIIGDGPEREKLERIVQRGNVAQSVTFTGQLTEQDDIAPHMMRALVSVSPGYIGLSAIHSLAYGAPLLVAEDEPHSPEIEAMEPGKTGRFYTPSTPEALGQALIEMLDDSEQLANMSADAVQSIQTRYSLSRMVQAFEESCQFAVNRS